MMVRESGTGQRRGGPGCLVGAVRLSALGVLGPAVAASRWWRRRRRGDAALVELDEGKLEHADAAFERLSLIVDVPPESERTARREVTTLVARVAEGLKTDGELYHLVYRLPWEGEAQLKSVGPRVQELGERVHLQLGRRELERLTSVWLVLPRNVYLGTVVDAGAYDPEADGEPDALIRRVACRWAFASAWWRGAASVLFRIVLYLPTGSADAVRTRVETLRARLT